MYREGTVADANRMTLAERLKYLRLIQPRYLQATRRERSAMLTEAERVTHRHRKTLIRRLHSNLAREPRRKQRGRTYGLEVEAAMRLIARVLEFPCAERLQPVLATTAAYLANHGELVLSPGLVDQLSQISVSTVGRMVQRMRRNGDRPRLPRGRPPHPNSLTRHVPAGRMSRHQPQPGHFEADLVHQAGVSATGLYVHTLQLVDIASGWSERVAILGRSYLVMRDAFARILSRLPFPMVELHPDNGGEFFNHFLMTYWREAVPDLALSRSRPFCKNDNPFVEEKNASAVRAYLGFDRLDTVAHTNLLNQIYDRMWLLHNFFFPVMRLQHKLFRPSAAAVRTFDVPQSPFDRLCAASILPQALQTQLVELRQRTNPRQLHDEVHTLLDRLFKLPNANPRVPQDVRKTLFRTALLQQDAELPVTLSFEGTIPFR